MFCPYCGNPCESTHRFCFRCGKALPELTADELLPEAVPAPETPLEPEAVDTALPMAEATELPEPEQTGSTPEAQPYLDRQEPEVPPVPPKKGRLWPPLLALCLMITVGLAAFFLTPKAPPAPVRSCFSIDNGVLYFDYTLYTGSDELVVPAEVDGMIVTAISENCFADCDGLTTVVLPETVTMIGSKAFAGCDALRGIYFPEGTLSIGAGALAQCPKLEAVYFPGTLAEIGDGCLDDCAGLQYIIYDGTYAQWKDLYDGIFQSQVELHTRDGVYRAQP